MVQFTINLNASTVAEALAMRGELLAAGISSPVVTTSSVQGDNEETQARKLWFEKFPNDQRFKRTTEEFEAGMTTAQAILSRLKLIAEGKLVIVNGKAIPADFPEQAQDDIADDGRDVFE